MIVTEALARSSLLMRVSDTPELDCQVLLTHVLQCNSAYLYTWPDKALTAIQKHTYEHLLSRRLTGEPIAFIVGKRDFWTLDLKVNASTLIPRPDTEVLVEAALACISDQPAHRILDLGTGTGAVALALASELPHSQVVGVDVMHDAVLLASENAERNHLKNAFFLQSNWFEQLPGQSSFDLIVSNPPYIAENDPALDSMVSQFEPKSALIAADNGLADIAYIIEHSRHYLSSEGWLCIEHGFEQALSVQSYFKLFDFQCVETRYDIANHPRVTIGQYTGRIQKI